MRSGICGKRRVCIWCMCNMRTRRSGCYTALEAFNEIIEFLVRHVSDVTDPEDRIFYFSQSAGDLNPEIVLQPTPKRGHIEAFRRNDACDSVSRLQRVDLHP